MLVRGQRRGEGGARVLVSCSQSQERGEGRKEGGARLSAPTLKKMKRGGTSGEAVGRIFFRVTKRFHWLNLHS
jgi:hypothetical protein